MPLKKDGAENLPERLYRRRNAGAERNNIIQARRADGTFPWEKGKQGPSDLTCINVFDSGCASVYVNEENRIVYMPLGLDMFDKLAKACDTIKEKLQAEKEKIVSSLDRLPFEYLETVSGKWYSALKWNTPPEEVVKNTSFSPEQEKRLTELHSALFETAKRSALQRLQDQEGRFRLPIHGSLQ